MAEATVESGAAHSRDLLRLVDEVLHRVGWKMDELDGFVVGCGPGSFTGVRVALATAKGLSFATGRPLAAVSSLAVLAHNLPCCPYPVVSCLDARKGEIYCRSFDSTKGLPLGRGAERVLPPETLARELGALGEPVMMVGTGALQYGELLTRELGALLQEPPWWAHQLRGAGLLAEARSAGRFEDPALVRATYIRPSEAELHVGPPEGGPPLKGRVAPDGTVGEGPPSGGRVERAGPRFG